MNLPTSNDAPPDDLLPATKAAQQAGCHTATLHRWVKKGHLRAWKRPGLAGKGRVFVSAADVKALLQPVEVRGKPAREKVKATTRRAQQRETARVLDRARI